ncbi:MAG: hypothetical protein IJG13_11035 [Kiritimatiellae bacterium]|nr:hypothetical protein [Kiritimatiellia bacterium]
MPRSLILIDNWAMLEVLDLFAKKRKGVKIWYNMRIESEDDERKREPDSYERSE